VSVRLIDIAKKTGFSVSTVSRVLHNGLRKHKISDKTKEQIKKAAKELGYKPNILARGLKLKKTHDIGVIVPDVSNPFFAALVKSIGEEVRKIGYSLILCDSNENILIEKEAIQLLLGKRVEGLIMASVGLFDEHIKNLEQSNLPVVMVDRCFDGLNFDSICVNNFKGSYLGTQHLIKEGHRKIAFIQGLPGTSTNEERLQGFKQALNSAKITIRNEYIVGDDFRSLNGYLQTKTLLNLTDPPTAIFTAGDLIALGAFQALKEENLNIPNNISIATFDDPAFASFLSPPLTAIKQPVEEMGIMAIKLIMSRMQDINSDKKRILLQPQLIVRNSVSRITKSNNDVLIENSTM
jgi:LacI family transcriptional regulator